MSSTQNETIQQAPNPNEILSQQQNTNVEQQTNMNIDNNNNSMEIDQQNTTTSQNMDGSSSSNLLSQLPENFRELSYNEISNHMGYPQDEKQRNEHFNEIIMKANNNKDDQNLQHEKELVFFLFKKKNEEMAASTERLMKENEDLKKQNQQSQQRFSKTIDGELTHKQNQLKKLFENNKNNAKYDDIITPQMKESILGAFQDVINEPDFERKSRLATLCSASFNDYTKSMTQDSRSNFSNSVNSFSKRSNNNSLNSIWQKNGTLGRTNFKPMKEPVSFKQPSNPVSQFSHQQVNNYNNNRNETKNAPYLFDKHQTESLSKKMNSFFSDDFLRQVQKEEELERQKKLNQ